MFKGEPTNGLNFYNLLNESEEFTSELGKVALASGKLEAELILFIARKGIKIKNDKATLGTLINLAVKNDLLEDNLRITLDIISKQRNYITHNIYGLFIDLKDETILEKNGLLDSDVLLYIERACQLREDLDELSEIIKNKK